LRRLWLRIRASRTKPTARSESRASPAGVCNCQVAVSLSLVNPWASLPIAEDLSLPEEWAKDPKRREQPGIPAASEFRTKPQLALGRIQTARRAGLDLGVLGAEVACGDEPDFRDSLTALDLRDCVGVRPATPVWEEGQGPLPPAASSGRGRNPARLRRAA